MEFKRFEGFFGGGLLQKEFDEKLPKCPFCGEYPHWLLNHKTGWSSNSTTCMCEKCKGKLNIIHSGLTIDDLQVVDLGEKNIYNLSLNSKYHVGTLSLLVSNSSITSPTMEIQSVNSTVSNYSNNVGTQKNVGVIIGIIIAILAIVGFSLFGIFVLGPDKGYYIGDTIKYDNVEIVVTDVSERVYNSDEFSGYTLIINFSMKNKNSEDFKFDLDNIYIKTEDKSEKYERIVYLGDSVIFDETLMPGGIYNYTLSYRVPYSLSEKKYSIFFDLKYLHSISQCHLYEK